MFYSSVTLGGIGRRNVGQAASLPYVLETHRGNNTLADAFVANAVGSNKGGKSCGEAPFLD
jgi:hypothetical protein